MFVVFIIGKGARKTFNEEEHKQSKNKAFEAFQRFFLLLF